MRKQANYPTNNELSMVDQNGNMWVPFRNNLNEEVWCDGHQKNCYGVYLNQQTDEKLCDCFFHCLGYASNGSVYTCERLELAGS